MNDTVTPLGDRTNLIWLWCYIPEEYHSQQDEGQQPNGDVEECDPVRVCDVIRITGKQENCEAAKRALLDLVPVTVEVGSSLELFRSWQLLMWLIIYCLSCEMKVPLDEFTTGHLSYAEWISPHLHTVYIRSTLILLSLFYRMDGLFPWGFWLKCVHFSSLSRVHSVHLQFGHLNWPNCAVLMT